MNEDNLVSFVLDQLSNMGGVRGRRMFGGWHISIDGVFFAAVHGERLYFKTNEASRERYESKGMCQPPACTEAVTPPTGSRRPR